MNSLNTDELRELLRPASVQCGVELIEVRWIAARGGGSLRLTIDSLNGVSLDDCAKFSEVAGAVLDVYDPIPNSYSLEVSSPGAERPIKTIEQWLHAVGKRVHVRYRDGASEREVEGDLVAAGGDEIELHVHAGKKERVVAVPAEHILAARTAVKL